MKKAFILIIFLGTAMLTTAQVTQKGTGKISGTVIDSGTNQPVEFATIALTDATGKTIDGTIADAKGKFTISKIVDGKYTVSLSFIGYQTITQSVELEGKKNDINLSTIKLEEEAHQLNEVIVEGKKDLVEERVDRTIYNAENDATTRGGDATDVLKRVPMLSVDLDGNVSMRGSTNITVLINNKPSTIMANSVADALKQIPSDQIKTVEVITSPSAKYDAEGSAGIINIITKKNTLQGLTLNVDAGAGFRGSNLGINGNYRKGKMGFSLGGFGRANYNVEGAFDNSQLTTTTDENQVSTQRLSLQNANNRSQGIFGNYNLGWDYDINKKNSVAASIRYGLRNNNSFQDALTSRIFENGNLLSSSLRDVNTKDLSATVDMNFTYTRLFEKPQREFSVLALYSRNDRNNDFTNTILNSTTEEITQRIKNLNDGLNEEYTIQADYQTPISDNQMFEVGVKEIRRKALSDFSYFTAAGADGEFVQDNGTTRSNQLNYNQDVLSSYLSHTYSAKSGYSFKSGLRYEYTVIKAFTRTEDNIDIPEYGVIVPSFNASKKLKKGTVKASYNRRIQRPSIQFLNPNIQNSNPLNVTIGNPSLNPEFTNNFELGYSTFFKGTSLNFTTFVRNSNNSIQSIRTPEERPEGTAIVTRYDNIGQENAYGMSFFSNVSLGKLSINGGGDVYYADLTNNVPNPEQNASNQGWVYSGRLFGSYDLGNNWALQGFSFYRGRRVLLQGYQGGFGIYSLGARKEFKSKKGSVGFGLENFLAPSMKIRNSTETSTIVQNSVTVLNNFSFRINVSYRIGKMSFDQPRRRSRSINNDDLKEGGDGGGGGGMDNTNGGGAQQQRTGAAVAVTGAQRPQGAAKPVVEDTSKVDPSAVVKAEGNWTYTIESPQGGGGVIKITKADDIYSGVIINSRNNREVALKTVTVKGNELSFSYENSFGGNTMEVTAKGIITGDQLSGTMAIGQFGTFPMNAKRTE